MLFLFGILIFCIYAVIDWLYVKYTLAVTEHRAVLAASYGLLMHLIAAVGVISYTENHWLILPLALGSWVGTYLSIRFHSSSASLAKKTSKVCFGEADLY